MIKSDYYSILGVDKTASTNDIRQAYRALAKKYHPDKYVGNPLSSLAEEKLKQINLAYEVLSNEELRREYDRPKSNQNKQKAKSQSRSKRSNEYSTNQSTSSQYTNTNQHKQTLLETIFIELGDATDSEDNSVVERNLYKLIIKYPTNPIVVGFHAVVRLINTGNITVANSAFDRAVQLGLSEELYRPLFDQILFLIWFNYSKSLDHASKTSDAIAACHMALTIQPDDPDAIAHMVLLCISQNMNSQADEYLQLLRSISPQHELFEELNSIELSTNSEVNSSYSEDTIAVACGVCGGVHNIIPFRHSYTCPRLNVEYSIIFGTVRAKLSRGNKANGSRYFRIRARHGEGEELYEWYGPYHLEIEAASGDLFALSIYNRKISAFHNLTVRTYTIFERYLPESKENPLLMTILGCMGMIIIVLGLIVGCNSLFFTPDNHQSTNTTRQNRKRNSAHVKFRKAVQNSNFVTLRHTCYLWVNGEDKKSVVLRKSKPFEKVTIIRRFRNSILVDSSSGNVWLSNKCIRKNAL